MAVKYYDGSVRGSELVLQHVKKRRKPGLILFGIFSLAFLAMGVIGFALQNYILVALAMVFILPFLIPGIVFLVHYLNPMSCKPLKKEPEILSWADYLFSHIAFQNDFCIAAPGYFAAKSDISRIIPQQDVLLMYKRIINTNYVTQYFLVVETVRGTYMLPFTRNMDSLVEQSVNVIGPGCQYAKAGYSQENLNYVEYMRTMWQEAQKQKQQQGGPWAN